MLKLSLIPAAACLACALSPLAAAEPAQDPRLLITDPGVLAQVESAGLGLTASLPAGALASVAKQVAADLAAMPAQDAHLGVGMQWPHRLFDHRWLSSPAAHFELAAVVNRLDRQPFNPAACGEVRLIYRLRYTAKTAGGSLTSRLPMTVNLVHWQNAPASPEKPAKDCAAVARRWQAAAGKDGAALAAWLTGADGPLRPEARTLASLKSLEVNLQSLRWPSTTRPDLGAHAEYLLRVFRYEAARRAFAPDVLENTPDVARLSSDPKLKAALRAWLRAPEHLQAVDAGIARVPDRYLAKQAVSVSPRGLTRLANRPFSRLYTTADFADLPFEGMTYAKSPEALLRRLDDLSCMGCHQNRSVAGFHALGIDHADTPADNAVAVIGSPHLALDQARRLAFLAAVAAGKSPDARRPLSERADHGEGGYGSHCGLGDPGFAAWTCGAGLACRPLGLARGDRTVGQCFPAGEHTVGDACEPGTMQANANSRRDRVVLQKTEDCAQGVCEVDEVGFPDGMCAVACDDRIPHSVCGGIAILASFNDCLAHHKPFTDCLAHNTRAAGLRGCSDREPCRDDYLCARSKSGAGACIPPYFLFQMRVDGHPSPP